jgi:glyoxylate reductase
MKPTAIVVNTARGACVDVPALVDALDAGRLLAAALDVFPDEPRIDPRLVGCSRVVLAPHIGSATTEARTQMAQLCVDAVIATLTGRRPATAVNPEVYG